MLVDEGVRLIKLFLHTSDAEHLRRFQERIATPTKRWKMSAEDIRNRAHRRDYLTALDDMFALTSTAAAPWHVVPAEYKWFARVAVAKTVVKALAKGLALGPPPLAPEVVKAAAEIMCRKENGGTRPSRARAGERLIAQSTLQLGDDPERLLAVADALDVVEGVAETPSSSPPSSAPPDAAQDDVLQREELVLACGSAPLLQIGSV